MDVTSLNHGWQKKKRHPSQGVGWFQQVKQMALGWPAEGNPRVGRNALQWHHHHCCGCQGLQRAKKRHVSTSLTHRSSGNKKHSPFESGEIKAKNSPQKNKEGKRKRAPCGPSAFWHPHMCWGGNLWLGFAPLVLQDTDEEITFWFASIWDQPLNYSLSEKKLEDLWNTRVTESNISDTHRGCLAPASL